jgi:flagellar hook protein FlgE
MEQSLLAASSGINANQTWLDAIGNNIANSNTTSYKQEEVGFSDLLAEQLTPAAAPTATNGGLNPASVGAGVQVGTVVEDQTQGSIQQTNVPTDLAIQGGGYLVASQGGQVFYTRDGQLSVDATGQLTAPNGALIQGWEASSSGAINTNAPLTNLTIPTAATLPATATSAITLGGNLPAGGTSPVSFTYNAYDSLGDPVPVTVTFTPSTTTPDTWTMQATVPSSSGTPTNLFSAAPTVTFSSSGTLKSISGVTANSNGSYTVPVTTMPGAPYQFATGATLSIDFPAPSSSQAVTQDAGSQSVQGTSQNGSAAGTLESYSIGGNGIITGSFSNGQTQSIGQIALATFPNAQGLLSTGNLMYQVSANSGQPNVTTPGSGKAGTLIGGALEASNVNLSAQLTDLIVAQEAYQANSKVITTSDTAIQSLLQVP